MDPFMAEVRIFGFNFAPKGWAFCNGQLIPISQNTALFSLLGTTYGGDGKSTFALPNIQGNVVMGPGQGPGLSDYSLGEMSGSDTVTLTTQDMPSHSHGLLANNQDAADTNVVSPTASLATSGGGGLYQAASNAQLNAQALALAGQSQPHHNMQPYLAMNFCIAMQGVYPPRG